MGTVISTCYVIEDLVTGVETTIYLERPETLREEKLHLCENVFEARKLIRNKTCQSIHIEVTSHVVSAETRMLLAGGV